MFERTEREVYTVNPLREVICQLNFPDILEITAKPPADFQKLIRNRYPFYYKRPAQGQFPADMPEAVQAAIVQQAGLQVALANHFVSKNQRTQVVLTQDSLIFASREYSDRNIFLEEVRAAESAFKQAYGELFYTRTGVKYINIINKSDERYAEKLITSRGGDRKTVKECDWLDLLRTSVVGLLGEAEFGSPVSSTNTSVFELPDQAGGLRIKHGLLDNKKRQEKDYLIEMDFYTKEHLGDEQLFERIRLFQESAGNIFRWAVRDELRNAFGIQLPNGDGD